MDYRVKIILRVIFSLAIILDFLLPSYSKNAKHNIQNSDYNSAPATIKILKDYPDKSCMEKVNLNAVTKKEIDRLAICTLAEIIKMGFPLCNEECLKKLTEEERNNFIEMRVQQAKYIYDKELERRIAEQIKRK